MARIEVQNDKTRALEEVEGSDGRLNVSSRSDTRAYYNSRDEKETYSIPYEHINASPGEFSVYVKNTSSKEMVLSRGSINSIEPCKLRLWLVEGDAIGGTEVTPTNLNGGSSNPANATVRQASEGDSITGITTKGQLDIEYLGANGHGEFVLNDALRLGRNDAIAIEYYQGTTGDFAGVVDLFFE